MANVANGLLGKLAYSVEDPWQTLDQQLSLWLQLKNTTNQMQAFKGVGLQLTFAGYMYSVSMLNTYGINECVLHKWMNEVVQQTVLPTVFTEIIPQQLSWIHQKLRNYKMIVQLDELLNIDIIFINTKGLTAICLWRRLKHYIQLTPTLSWGCLQPCWQTHRWYETH